MTFRREKLPPALKHAAYSATSILPGESLAEFEKLHQSLIADISPAGPLEEDIVATMARLLWRKQHFNTLRIADVARRRGNEIDSKSTDNFLEAKFEHLAEIDPAVRKAAVRAAQRQKEEELGEAYALVELGDAATLECLMKELEVLDRLDSMIDRCIKRLLMVRGVKSLSPPSSGPAILLPAPSVAA